MAEALTTHRCIAGGGPAGMMLGLLLARMGVEVTVLEKHADFLRDFRGDTTGPNMSGLPRFLSRFQVMPGCAPAVEANVTTSALMGRANATNQKF